MSESKDQYDKSRYRRQAAPGIELSRALQGYQQNRARATAWVGWRPALAGLLVITIVTSIVLQNAETPVESTVALLDEMQPTATSASLELLETSDWSSIPRVVVGNPIADVSRFSGATRSLSAIHTRVDVAIPRLNHISLSELKPEES